MLRRSTMLVVILSAWLSSGGLAHAQLQVNADYLLWSRNDSNSTKLLTGPEGMSSTNDYGYQSGYRFGIVGGYDWFEVEAVFAQIDDWSANRTQTLTSGLALDDTANNPFVFPGGPANVIAFKNSVFLAATSNGGVGVNETLEGEILQPGAIAKLRQTSRYRDFELNFSQNRTKGWYRFGLGYRNIKLNDRTQFATIGTFDAIDVDDGAVSGGAGNDQNDALSDSAITAAGFTLASGAADGFDAADVAGAGPDTLAVFYSGSADNELNGIQAIAAAQILPTEIVYVEVIGKAGVYHNSVHARLNETLFGSGNDNSVYSRSFSDQKGTASFAGSLGLQARVPLTDYITFSTGYEAMVVTGIANGSDQLSGINANLLGVRSFSARANDSTLLHGARFGLEVTF